MTKSLSQNDKMKYLKSIIPIGYPIFIETGTYIGDTIRSMSNHFDKVISIELSKNLYNEVNKKFGNMKNVELLCGDSAVILEKLLPTISDRCVFWLDAHYSRGNTAKGAKETPIVEELQIINKHSVKQHLILIDDIRHFNGKNDYPALDDIKTIIYSINKDYIIKVENDILSAILQ